MYDARHLGRLPLLGERAGVRGGLTAVIGQTRNWRSNPFSCSLSCPRRRLAALDCSAADAVLCESPAAWVTFWLMSSTTWACCNVALAIEAFSPFRLRNAWPIALRLAPASPACSMVSCDALLLSP